MSALGKAAIGRIEDDVAFVDAAASSADGTRVQSFQRTPEGVGVADLQLDFDFRWHISPATAVNDFLPPRSSASIADECILHSQSVSLAEPVAAPGDRPPSAPNQKTHEPRRQSSAGFFK